MAESRRRRVDARVIFQGQEVGPTMLSEMWTQGEENRVRWTRRRTAVARGLRLQTTTITLKPTWVQRHREAAQWVVKVLPERRTLERDLIASVGAVEPYYSRVAIGDREGDYDDAEACENYMETWRKAAVPAPTMFEKAVEDGSFGLAVLPSDADYGGMPDFYDRLDEAAYADLDDEHKAAYSQDDGDPKKRYVSLDAEGRKRPNPRFDRDKAGKRRGKDAQDFVRDDEKSKEAHRLAVQRYLLKQAQGGVSVRLVPSNDCIPYLVRGTGRERWRTVALLERTLYSSEDLLQQGYGWKGMGNRALIPQGYEEGRTEGQNGLLYLYTLYTTWTDPEEMRRTGRRVERPLVVYSVAGQPTWNGGADPPAGEALPDNGVAVIDLYETLGLTGSHVWYGGGLHTADDDPDFYWEPYLTPLASTILTIEGLQTMGNAATATNATPGYYHKPDAALLSVEGMDAEDALIDGDTKALRVPKIPASGEIETVVGDIVPASPAMVSPDLWRTIALEQESLRANTALDQGGSSAQDSGRAMVVRETIAQTSRRHVREGIQTASKFAGERALCIFAAIAREHDVRWPLQTTQERAVGAESRTSSTVLEFDPDWIGEGEYALTAEYPSEENPVRVEMALARIERGVGSLEELAEALGVTDVETWWSKVLKTQVRMSPEYRQAQITRLAKRQGNKLMLKVIALQNQQKLTGQGLPGFEQGLPTAALGGGGGGGNGGPNTAQRSLGGQKAAVLAPPMQDARAQMMVGQQQQGAA